MSQELHIYDSESEQKYGSGYHMKFQNKKASNTLSSQEKIKFYDAASAGNLQTHLPLS